MRSLWEHLTILRMQKNTLGKFLEEKPLPLRLALWVNSGSYMGFTQALTKKFDIVLKNCDFMVLSHGLLKYSCPFHRYEQHETRLKGGFFLDE